MDAAAGIAGHPIDLLVQLGFRVTVNTDNRLVSDVSLTDELYLLAETFGYSLSELLDLQLNAAEAAFLSVEEREDLAEILVAGWGEVISGDVVGPVLEELDDEDEDD
ncbi:adenosine deaminase [Micrococcus aloeverae]